jgi:hypothetical protein
MVDTTINEKYISRDIWEKILSQPFPCQYMKLYRELNLIKKDETLKAVYNIFVREKVQVLSKKLGKKMVVVDWLSAYGNCLLTILYDLDPEQIYENLCTEDKAAKLKDNIKRSFECETVATDICQSVLDYGKSQGIFDKIYKYDINKIFSENEYLEITKNYMTIGNLMYLGSICYIEDEVIMKLIEWFSEGKEEGYLFVSFAFPLDVVERNNRIKNAFLDKLDFVGSLPGHHRDLLPNEVEYQKKYRTNISYQETWCLKRRI